MLAENWIHSVEDLSGQRFATPSSPVDYAFNAAMGTDNSSGRCVCEGARLVPPGRDPEAWLAERTRAGGTAAHRLDAEMRSPPGASIQSSARMTRRSPGSPKIRERGVGYPAGGTRSDDTSDLPVCPSTRSPSSKPRGLPSRCARPPSADGASPSRGTSMRRSSCSETALRRCRPIDLPHDYHPYWMEAARRLAGSFLSSTAPARTTHACRQVLPAVYRPEQRVDAIRCS